MAAAPVAMTPPPTANGAPPSPAQVNPTSPPAVSPAPPVPSPQLQQGTDLSIRIVRDLIALAKMFPEISPKVSQINNLMREVAAGIQESSQTGEPMAPPSNG